MSTIDKTMLRGCLLESTLQEIREIEAIDYSDIRADESFRNKILNAISTKEVKGKKSRSKRIAISLIAAIIVCFSIIFSVSAKVRTTIVSFFVEVYDGFATFFIEDDENTENPTIIETRYEPTYLKENGYEQISQSKNKYNIFTVWSKDGASVNLSQYIINKNSISLDVEDASYETTYIGDKEVYYTVKNDMYFVKWLEGGYSFSLICNTSSGWETIEKIVSSLEPIYE